MFAFEMFSKGRDYLEPLDLDSVHAKYEREYMMTADQHAWLSELHVARLLTTSSGQTRFLYRYAYYFFLAFYLHDGISNVKEAPALRSVLTQMLNDTYVEENSHILIFYLYLSKDRLLIEDLLRKAKESFKDYSECDLAKDVEFANALCNSNPKILVPSADIANNRVESREIKDDIAEKQNGIEVQTGNRDIDSAFHILNIMGQVVRNFPGDLKSET